MHLQNLMHAFEIIRKKSANYAIWANQSKMIKPSTLKKFKECSFLPKKIKKDFLAYTYT